MNNKSLLWILGIAAILMIVFGLGNKYFVDKVADRVIEKLQKNYSPSPYGPGVDPDKLDFEKIKKNNK